MKNEGFFKRIENYWYYYKWQTILAVVFVLALYAFFSTTLKNTAPSDVQILSAYSAFITDKEYGFENAFLDTICDADKNGKKEVTSEELYITAEGKSDNDAVELAKFQNNISNSKSDLILMDEYNFARFSALDYYEDLSKFIDITKYDKENVIYRSEKPVAIRLVGSKFLKNAEFKTDTVYAGIMFVPENADETLLKKRENAAKILIELAK